MPIDHDLVQAVFLAAAEKDAGDRIPLLDRECGSDAELRQRVEALLRSHDDPVSFLDQVTGEFGPTFRPPSTEKPGERIGAYIIREQIGEGGFGVVYVAEQEEPVKRKVALKIIKTGMETREIIARFEAERQALALMDHPNIATVLDVGATESGRPYFVMELVRGVSITDFCDQQQLSIREQLDLFLDVCRAVQHAHQKGIIHRDLKPSNVMVTMRDDRAIAKVIDFGVSKALHMKLTDNTIYTAFGQLIGTPLYMSPEQAQMNDMDADTRSDVYSLGVLLYELLTGNTPFEKETLKKASFAEMQQIIREDEPPRPSARLSTLNMEALSTVSEKRSIDRRILVRSYQGELDWIVMKALEKDRDRRYESTSALAADVRCYLNGEPVQARAPSVGYRLRKSLRRNKLRLAAATVLAVAMLVAVGSIAGSVGWMTRDRVARQARMAGQIESILHEVDRLIEQRKWPEAFEAAKRAEPLIKGGEVAEAVRTRSLQVLADLDMVQRLHEIRLQHGSLTAKTGFDNKTTDRAYAQAFREYGIDVEKLSEAEAGDKCRAHVRVSVPLAMALDDWAMVLHGIKEARWQRLLKIATMVDSDPSRSRLRELFAQEITDEVKNELRRLVEAQRFNDEPASVLFLGMVLVHAELNANAESVLRQTQQSYPADFWVNFSLAHLIAGTNPGEAIRFYTAAIALRPDSAAVFNNLGLAFMARGNLDEGIACYKRAIELDANYVHPYNNLGNAVLDQKKQDEAIAWYNKAIEIEPKYAMAYRNIGNVLIGQGKLEEALVFSKKAIELDPDLASAHNDVGVIFFEGQSNRESAIACYRKAIELNPKEDIYYGNLAEVLADSGNYGEAVAVLRKANEFVPEPVGLLRKLGDYLRHEEKYDEAIAMYRLAIKSHPNEPSLFHDLGDCLCHEKKCDEAIAMYRLAIKSHPNEPALFRYLATTLHEMGSHEEAVAFLKQWLQDDPENVEAYNTACYNLIDWGRLDAAIEVINKALKIGQQPAAFHRRLGDVYRRQGKHDLARASYQAALASYQAAIKKAPDDEMAYYYRAKVYCNLGQYELAMADYRKIFAVDPHSRTFKYGVAVLMLNCPDHRFRDATEALRLATEAVRLKSWSGNTRFVLGQAQYRNGDYAGAIETLEKSLEQHCVRKAQCWFVLAMAHWKLGQHEQARGYYDKAFGWMQTNHPPDETFPQSQFRDEAAAVLGVTETTETKTHEATN